MAQSRLSTVLRPRLQVLDGLCKPGHAGSATQVQLASEAADSTRGIPAGNLSNLWYTAAAKFDIADQPAAVAQLLSYNAGEVALHVDCLSGQASNRWEYEPLIRCSLQIRLPSVWNCARPLSVTGVLFGD